MDYLREWKLKPRRRTTEEERLRHELNLALNRIAALNRRLAVLEDIRRWTQTEARRMIHNG
jgi:hypothetical protein